MMVMLIVVFILLIVIRLVEVKFRIFHLGQTQALNYTKFEQMIRWVYSFVIQAIQPKSLLMTMEMLE